MVYASVDGREGTFAVPAGLARSADVTAADLRSDRLAPPISAADLQGLAISASALGQAPGFAVECRRTGDHWELTAPVADLADAAVVAAVADEISPTAWPPGTSPPAARATMDSTARR